MRTWRLTTLACVALMLLGVGCRDRSTAQDKEDKLCVELGELDQSITKLASLAASGGDPAMVATLRAEIEARYAEAQKAAEDTPALTSSMAKVNAAYDMVIQSISGVNSEATLREAQPRIDSAAGEYATARLELYDTAGCA